VHAIPATAQITLFQQVVKIALLDSFDKFLPFFTRIAEDGAAGFPGVSYQDCLLIGRYLDARAAVAAEGGAPGEASTAPSISHDIIS
jgi:hypothetical protein